jgi:hypothetical protein
MAYTQQTPIGTPDVNLITKTLAGLQPDSALQQYAMMHKNNPYILSLAKSESDRRKSLRMAAQGNPGQMPTVADREIAGMATPVMTGAGVPLQTGYGGRVQTELPENQGIAQIPAPNMQRMADGGIAGYEDDEEGMATGGMGGMFNFAQQSEPVVRMSGGGVPGYAAGVYNEERFKEFLKKEGKTSEFANASPKEKQKILTEFANKTSGPQKAAAPAASTYAPTSSVKAAATPEDPRLLRKISEKVGSGAGTLLRRAGPAGLGIQALSNMGDYKAQRPDNVDTSLSGTVKDLMAGDFDRVGTGLRRGFGEALLDTGSFGANMLDYVVPGKAPVSSAYERWVKENIPNMQGPSDRAQPAQVKQPAAAPAPEVTPEVEDAAAASKNVSNTGGVTDLLPGTTRLDTSYMPAAAAAPTAASAKSKASELYDSKGQIRSLEGKQAQARQDIFNQRDERVAQLDAFNKQQGPAFASYEKMLQKEELQDVTDKEKSGLMSLMKGFLAMAAGESPNAATNIAKGAMVGMGDYGDALKEFKKAAKERTKAMADIENARRSEAKGDFKDTQMYTDRANERLAASDDRFTGLISQITGKEAEVATNLYNNMESIAANKDLAVMKERGLNTRAVLGENRADARAQMLTGDARTAMMLGTGNTQAERLKSGMMVLQELSTDKSGAKTVETLAKINSDRAKNGEAPISMADLVNSAREYSALMYPKVTNEAPTRAR